MNQCSLHEQEVKVMKVQPSATGKNVL